MQHSHLEPASAIIHELWMKWAKTMIESEPNLSPERKARWENECFKDYEMLSEEMKDLDRQFAKRFIDLLSGKHNLHPYLSDELCALRLLEEYKKYNTLTVAYDFDNTVYDYHKKGHNYSEVIELIREAKELGCYLIVFTANNNLTMVSKFLFDNNIPFDAINENPPFFKSAARKIYSNILLDDRAGLNSAFFQLKSVFNTIKNQL